MQDGATDMVNATLWSPSQNGTESLTKIFSGMGWKRRRRVCFGPKTPLEEGLGRKFYKRYVSTADLGCANLRTQPGH